MAYDSGMLRAVIGELERFVGAKVEKVYQPLAYRIVLGLHTPQGHAKLDLNINPAAARLSATETTAENPASPPMFCMLLRKHLTGARLLSITQDGFERTARLTFRTWDEMGFEDSKSLVIEIMGKYSNIIFLDSSDRIVSALKTVDFTTSRLRQILPGMIYEAPPSQGKRDPLTETRERFDVLLAARLDSAPDKFLNANYMGISSVAAREIVCRANVGEVSSVIECENRRPGALGDAFFEWFGALAAGESRPCAVYRDGMPLEYCYFELTQYGDSAEARVYESFGEMFDEFFTERDRAEKVKLLSSDISTLINRGLVRAERKLALQREELAECESAEEYKRNGDLITAYIYMIKRGDTFIDAIDYTAEEPTQVRVELDPRLSPSQNAQRMYRLYAKLKRKKAHLAEQIVNTQNELEYLGSVRCMLDNSESEGDMRAIRDELVQTGYISRDKAKRAADKRKIEPHEFITRGGYRLLCGKNNLQNDHITHKIAGGGDLWFHAKGIPGSHVVLLCSGEEPSSEDYTDAAQVAAFYSKAPRGSFVDIDYTRVKNIKKPTGTPPGFVTYSTNYSAYVKAELPTTLVRRH